MVRDQLCKHLKDCKFIQVSEYTELHETIPVDITWHGFSRSSELRWLEVPDKCFRNGIYRKGEGFYF